MATPNPNQQPGSAFEQRVLNESSKATYSVSQNAAAPYAAATALIALTAPAASGKVLSLSNVRVSGVATATGEVDILLYKTSILSGGTSSTATVVPHDSQDPTNVGVVSVYSALPAVFTGVQLRSRHLQLAANGTQAAPIDEVVWDFGDRAAKMPKLRPFVNEGYVIALSGVTAPAGTSLTFSIEWTEE